MKKTVKALHLIGLVMFFGGILPSIVMNTVVGASTNLALIYHQRQFVSAITVALTIPGMLILIVTGGFAMVAGRYSPLDRRWLAVKLILAVLILFNGAFILAPLVDQVTSLAARSVTEGQLAPNYWLLKEQEDRYGIGNFVMLLVAFTLAVYRPSFRRGRN